MSKFQFVILGNENDQDHYLWIKACEDYKELIDYRVVDLTRNNWLKNIQQSHFDLLLAKPGGVTKQYKQLYDERVMILSRELNYPIYPGLDEILIYENKKYFSYWLEAHAIPHPKTFVFYHKKEALDFISQTGFPIVAKLNIGASGNGVDILYNKETALKYVEEIFSEGRSPRTGPKLNKGRLIQRAFKMLTDPVKLKRKLLHYQSIRNDVQKDFLLFQEFIKHDYEWRVVRIGDSFFAHKKLKSGQKASGSLLKGYENPPLILFDFVKEITDKYELYSQSVDVFEPAPGQFIVNEMQCIFGQSDPHQMLVNKTPGRYIYNGTWVFEPGDFNRNQSYNLRIEYAMHMVAQRQKQ